MRLYAARFDEILREVFFYEYVSREPFIVKFELSRLEIFIIPRRPDYVFPCRLVCEQEFEGGRERLLNLAFF
ncbi:MAG: hypothetical protein LUD52_04635 [Opitutae bacterium]|nr:hypothetical protein [Opitutae bacterium]